MVTYAQRELTMAGVACAALVGLCSWAYESLSEDVNTHREQKQQREKLIGEVEKKIGAHDGAPGVSSADLTVFLLTHDFSPDLDVHALLGNMPEETLRNYVK